jgi:hypothetical protein
MTAQLNGRWGPYEPKTPGDKAKARKQASERRQSQAQVRDFLEKHKSCANGGCGRPVAFYEDSPVLSLKHGGCCSEECQRAVEVKASSPVAPVKMARDDYEDRRERQRQGIELAKAAGRYSGRKTDTAMHARIAALRAGGNSITETAKLAGCSLSQVKRVCAMRAEKASL